MKTKIVVLHLKEVLFTALFAILGILLIAMVLVLVFPNESEKSSKSSNALQKGNTYIAGEYTTPVTLGNQTLHIRVKVSENEITEISFVDLTSEMKTMYPLLIPTLEDLSDQIIQNQSIDDVVYPDDRKYTSLVLLNAIKEALSQAAD